MRFSLAPLALAMAITPSLALSSEPLVVTTAGRTAQSLKQTTAAVTVLTRADLERIQATSVPEALQRVPGVQISPSGGAGSTTGIFLRGASSEQTLILVDGQRINSATLGSASLQHLNIDQVERIEVVRGPRSALYGSEAIGGVIQIFTRQGYYNQGLKPRVSFAGGTEGTWRRHIGLSGGDAKTRFDLSGSLNETQGIDFSENRNGRLSDHDAYRQQAYSASLAHQLNDDLEVGLNTQEQSGRLEYDNTFSATQEPYNRFEISASSLFANWRASDLLTTRLEIGHSEDRSRNLVKNSTSESVFNTYRDSASWLNTLTLNEQHSVLAGLDWQEDRIHSSNNYAKDQRINRAAFVQHRFNGEYFSTELGVRHDDNEHYGEQDSWNASTIIPLASTTQLVLGYNEGFRAPTFNDLYYPGSESPDLKPETSKNYEIQLRGEHWQTQWSATAFRNNVQELIEWAPIAPGSWTWKPSNVKDARLQGIELEAKRSIYGWNTRLAASFVDPRDRESGHTLQRRARRTLNLDVDRQIGLFSVGASWHASSMRFQNTSNTTESGGYGVVDLRGSWHMSDELRWDLKVTNLLNKHYTVVEGYEQPGTGALLGLTWTPAL